MPFFGEIRMFAGNFAPAGWELGQGQLLSISENEALFDVIGTIYGGDGQNTFALPDLRGRAPIHQGTLSGTTFNLGDWGGVESVKLNLQEVPTHSHQLQGTTSRASTPIPADVLLADTQQPSVLPYGTAAPFVPLAPAAVSPIGGSQPHDNLQPYLVVNFIICTNGVVPAPDGPRGGSDDPFLAEIRIFPYNFVPVGWTACSGQLLPISQNTALFSLLGTFYGGNGRTTFALPNLQASTPMGAGQGAGLSDRVLGESGGSGAVVINSSELPGHTHSWIASAAPGSSTDPSGQLTAATSKLAMYGPPEQMQAMDQIAIQAAGGGQPHNNVQPYLGLSYCIAVQGVFPPRP